MIEVWIPTKPNIDARLMWYSCIVENGLDIYCKSKGIAVRIRRFFGGDGDAHITTFQERVKHMATIRNTMVKLMMEPDVTHILWIDSDVMYRCNLLEELLKTSSTDIVAPAVYLSHEKKQWYDIGGFWDAGKPFNLFPPHCSQNTRILDLESVGACYLMPTRVFTEFGAKYEWTHPAKAEHNAVCEVARQHGMKVLCNMDLVVNHVYLPMFGENIHQ